MCRNLYKEKSIRLLGMAVADLLGKASLIIFAVFLVVGIVKIIDAQDDPQAFIEGCMAEADTCAKGLTMYTLGKGAINPPYYQKDWLPPKNQVVQVGNQSAILYTPILEDGFSADAIDFIFLIPILFLLVIPLIFKTPWKAKTYIKVLLFLLVFILVFVGIKMLEWNIMLEGGEQLGMDAETTRAVRQLEVDFAKEKQTVLPTLILGGIAILGAITGTMRMFKK